VKLKRKVLNYSIAAALATVSNLAMAAGGFALVEQSGSGMGNSFAGGAASAEDATTIYYNPAGMSRLSGSQAAVALHAIRPTAKFSDTGSTAAALQAPPGNTGGDPGSLGLVPNAYFATEISPEMRFGLGLGVPFGLQTEYDANWIGRFQAVKSKLQTLNLNPSLSYRVNDALSLGAGLSYQSIKGELTSMTNYSAAAAAAAAVLPAGPVQAAMLGIAASNSSGLGTITGSDSSWGYNFGALVQATPQTRIGLSYRSTINYNLSGTATFANRPAALATVVPDGAVTLAVKMPDSFSASVFHQLNEKWDVMADASWTGWSVFQQLKIDRINGTNLITVQENWRDTWRIAVGGNYHYNERCMARMGVAYDQTPVPDAFRTARIPDQNRTWLSLGGQYKLGKNSAVDLAYSHLFIPDAPIADRQAAGGKGDLVGMYSSISSNILSVQYTHGF
jgi:long-chain fatty acid transport protein